MSNTKLTGIVGESITFATGDLVRCFNKAYGAIGVDIRGAVLANDGWNFTPLLQKAWKFTASGSVYRDDTDALRERGTSTTATYNSMAADVDFIYIGCDVPFRGAYVNVVNANGTASVLVATYSKNDGTFAGLTETDNTASGGASLAIDNSMTWTVPTDWEKRVINGSGPHFWVRLAFDGGTDSATSLAEIIPMPIQPSVSSAVGGADTPVLVATAVANNRYWFDPSVVGGIEITAANTEVVRVEWLCAGRNSTVVTQ